MAINYYLLVVADTIIGPGSTTEEQLPPGCIACTQAQTETWQTLEIVAGVIQAIPAAALLLSAQRAQKVLIKSGFLSAANANVTDSSGNIWEGGMASGNSIFLGCQLAQQNGATSITLYDAAKAPHSMTIAEGMAVAALIGTTYQTALGTKNALYGQINAATTVSAVQAIIYS